MTMTTPSRFDNGYRMIIPGMAVYQLYGDRHESLKPLITAWLDISIDTLLSFPENPDRRIWVIFDELGRLQRLPY